MRHLRRLEPAAVLLVIGLALFYRLDAVPFYVDESCKIGYSAPFEAFANGRFTDPIWQTREDKYLNPVLTYYVVGAARRIGGYGPDRLNPPWNFAVSNEENIRRGRVPEPRLLWWSRAGVTAAACAGLFTMFALMTGACRRWAAFVWLGLTLTNPFLRTTLRQALNEGVLVATIALVLWTLYRALQRFDRDAGPGIPWRAMAWIAAAGLCAGLAAQSKLNGGAAAAGAWVVVMLASARWPIARRSKFRILLLSTIILAACSAGAFVGSNPSLWPHPPKESVRMVRTRVQVLDAQVKQFGHSAIVGVEDRLRRVPVEVLHTGAAFPRGPLNLVFFVAGAGASLMTLAMWLRARDGNHARVVLTVVGGIVSLPGLLTPIDWARYFVLPVVFSSVQIAFGMEWLAGHAWRALSAARTRQ